MIVFVTGGTGFIGSALIEELLRAGHTILALARSDQSAQALAGLKGVTVLRGDIEDLDVLKDGAQRADATIHLAFIHDFANYLEVCQKDRAAVEAIASALKGTGKSFVIASGSLTTAGQGKDSDESGDAVLTVAGGNPRGATDNYAVGLRSQGIQTTVARLAPTVHGEGDHGFVPSLIRTAREKGVSVYVDEGSNKWPAIHRRDAANLFRLIIEKKDVAPPRVLAVAEQGIPFKSIAEAIGKKYNIPIVSQSKEQALQHLGFLGRIVSLDNPTNNSMTRQVLGWTPTAPSLLDDILECY
ncbi:unnamed protein product [Sympodiomycopsis kandeliae]